MDENIKFYFWQSVVKYSKGDVCCLLEARLKCAGPLLNTVLSGIDNLGGMCYGFLPNNSGDRSVKFMKNHMGIPEAIARFLYSIVRCGIVHQGMPKIGLKFFVLYDRIEKDKIFYTGVDQYIWLNVIELAYSYIDIIESISKDLERHVHFIPSPSNEAQQYFNDAKNEISNNIESLWEKISEQSQDKQLKEGELTVISSSSAFNPDNMLVIGTYPIEL